MQMSKVKPTPLKCGCGSLNNAVVRDAWLDWCRLFAVSAIVLTHCVEQFYPLSAKPPALLLFTIGRLGVPVFLFLSGYLLPSRYEIKCREDYLLFVVKKWLPLFLCVEIWIVIYGVNFLIVSDNVRWFDVIRWMLFNQMVPLSHWWYMPMILGAYLGIPLLSVFKNVLGRSFVVWLFAVSAFAHILKYVLRVGFVDLSFVGDCYFTYIIFGYLVCLYRESAFRWIAMRMVRIGIWGLFLVNVAVCLYWQIGRGRTKFIWYSAPCLITAGLMVPLLLKTFPNCRCSWVSFVSIASFGVYLLHNLILSHMRVLLSGIDPGYVRCALAWGIAMGISLAIVALSRRIPIVSRLLFLVK